MSTVWAPRREDLVRDCLVSPDVFHPRVDRLCAFVGPDQHARETETGQRNGPLYLQGLLSHWPGQNAEAMATFVDVERPILPDFIGTLPWAQRPLITVLVGQGAERVGEPAGLSAFDPSRFPKRGTPSVGGKRPWGSHRGKGDHGPVGVVMGYVSHPAHAVLDFRVALPREWTRHAQRRRACHGPPAVQEQTRQAQGGERLALGGAQGAQGGAEGREGWGRGDDALGRQTRWRQELRAWRALWVGRARHHAPTRPGSPSPRVRRAWTAAPAPLAIGDRWAPGPRSDRLDPF